MGMISQKLRDSAKGQKCTLCIPMVCDGGGETTVLAHIRDGVKGLGNKANDWSACFSCGPCHDHLDQHRLSYQDELFYSLRGLQRTMARWIEVGLVTIAGDTGKTRPGKKANMPSKKQTKAKASGKIVQRRHIATGELIDDRD